MDETKESRNKALVLEAFDALFNRRDYSEAERYWSPGYIQHSAHIKPGREGLFDLIKGLPPTLRYEPGAIVADGPVGHRGTRAREAARIGSVPTGEGGEKAVGIALTERNAFWVTAEIGYIRSAPARGVEPASSAQEMEPGIVCPSCQSRRTVKSF